jgi:hypothetical protein
MDSITFTLRPVKVFMSQGFKLEMNGKVPDWHGLPITTYASHGDIEAALAVLASRPTCHEVKCVGCPEGWAAEVARGMLDARNH